MITNHVRRIQSTLSNQILCVRIWVEWSYSRYQVWPRNYRLCSFLCAHGDSSEEKIGLTQERRGKKYKQQNVSLITIHVSSLLVWPDIAENWFRYKENLSDLTKWDNSLIHSRPSLVANLLMESSLSPLARTWPQRAKVVEVGRALPSASTSTTENWTEAWSFEVMRRSIFNNV